MVSFFTKAKKEEILLEFLFLVDQTLRISNLSFIEGLLLIQSFIEMIDR